MDTITTPRHPIILTAFQGDPEQTMGALIWRLRYAQSVHLRRGDESYSGTFDEVLVAVGDDAELRDALAVPDCVHWRGKTYTRDGLHGLLEKGDDTERHYARELLKVL